MKKIFFLLAIMFATLTSCTTDENTIQSTIPQTTSVTFAIDQQNTSSTNSKQIKRGTIPVWVNTLSISASQNNGQYTYNVSDTFTFDEKNGSSFISLDKVALGENTFVGVTTTDSPQFFQLTNFTSNESSTVKRFEAGLKNIDKENPYVLYSGTVKSNIKPTGSNNVDIPMQTKNGRILTVFQVTDKLKQLGYQAKITASRDNSSIGENKQSSITKNNELVTFKWSDSKALKDVVVTYKVEFSLINNQDVIVETHDIKQTVLGSTSLECYYELDLKE